MFLVLLHQLFFTREWVGYDPALALASPAVMWGNAEGMIGICVTAGMFILMAFSCVLTCF
jgi:hypothetical protein